MMSYSLKKALEKAKRMVNKNAYSITDLIVGTAYEFGLTKAEARVLNDKIADYLEKHFTLYDASDVAFLRRWRVEDQI